MILVVANFFTSFIVVATLITFLVVSIFYQLLGGSYICLKNVWL